MRCVACATIPSRASTGTSSRVYVKNHRNFAFPKFVRLQRIKTVSGNLSMESSYSSIGHESSTRAEHTVGEKDGVIIVDHGSRRQESNLMLNEYVAMFKSRTGYRIVEPAHMLEPSCWSYAPCPQLVGKERIQMIRRSCFYFVARRRGAEGEISLFLLCRWHMQVVFTKLIQLAREFIYDLYIILSSFRSMYFWSSKSSTHGMYVYARSNIQYRGNKSSMGWQELAAPSIRDAFRQCVQKGANRVIVSPFFLFPGRHWQQDIPALVAEASREHPGISYIITAPLGLHELMVDVMNDRIKHCLSHVAGDANECSVCAGTGKCRLY
ncbi:sirohydrochlorin ferrochelatase, chloroplastic isoform X1 [Typha latifolia]|uniref:sirohydrochlorin ferrochelatase, chloroplastic isoform X1 n=1 Tax=Typha latifolia TaxID=4733 RepID=UPI003C2E6283